MRRFLLFSFGLFVALQLTVPAQAQKLSDVVAKVKAAVTQKEPCWELKRVQDRHFDDTDASDQDWVCREQVVNVYYFQQRSTEDAAKLLKEIITSPVQAPGQHVPSPKIGDESSISTGGYSTSSYVFFRRGNIVVRIDSNILEKPEAARTLKNAIEFAQLVDEQIVALK